MTKLTYAAVAITGSEYEAWQSFGNIRTSSHRWINIEFTPDGNSEDAEAICTLFKHAPDLLPNFETDILIALTNTQNGMTEQFTICDFSQVVTVFALNKRSTSILEDRFPNLEEPLFENQWSEFRQLGWIERSLNNGFALFNIKKLDKNRQKYCIEEIITEDVKSQISEAIRLYVFRKELGNSKEPTYLSSLFEFERHYKQTGGNDPDSKHKDFDYAINLGLFARRRLGEHLTTGFTSYGQFLQGKEDLDLVELILHPEAKQVYKLILDDEPAEFSIRPASQLLFLKWRDKCYENSKIDWEKLKPDCKHLTAGGGSNMLVSRHFFY